MSWKISWQPLNRLNIEGNKPEEKITRMQAVIGTLPADNTSLAGSNPKSYHLSYGNQSFYSVSGSVPLAPDQISQRVALIDQLLAVNPNPAAADVLQRARASLISRQ